MLPRPAAPSTSAKVRPVGTPRRARPRRRHPCSRMWTRSPSLVGGRWAGGGVRVQRPRCPEEVARGHNRFVVGNRQDPPAPARQARQGAGGPSGPRFRFAPPYTDVLRLLCRSAARREHGARIPAIAASWFCSGFAALRTIGACAAPTRTVGGLRCRSAASEHGARIPVVAASWFCSRLAPLLHGPSGLAPRLHEPSGLAL